MRNEEWRPSVEFPGFYAVSRHGEVARYNFDTGHFALVPNYTGSVTVSLAVDGVSYSRSSNKMRREAFPELAGFVRSNFQPSRETERSAPTIPDMKPLPTPPVEWSEATDAYDWLED